MNQRQKKKSSQHRKRHFDAAKARESGRSSGAQKQHTKEQPKPHPPPLTTSQPQSDKVNDIDVAPVASSVAASTVTVPQGHRKTFSKRKVVSNWDKYDEEGLEGEESISGQESEEALQGRLLQLFNLPLTHALPSLSDISDGQGSSTQELDDEGPGFLTLDCSALAEALSTLPLYKRLDIDPELFPYDSKEDGMVSLSVASSCKSVVLQGRDSLNLAKTSKNFSEQEDTQTRDGSDSRVGHSLQIAGAPTQPVASGTVGGGSKPSASADNREERELEKLLHVSKTVEGWSERKRDHNPLASRTVGGSKQLASTVDNEERELEILLSKKIEGQSENSRGPKPELPFGDDKREDRTSVPLEIKSHTCNIPIAVDDESTELDDMLDELLS